MQISTKFRLSVILHAISKGSTFLQTLIITPLLINAVGPNTFGTLMVCHSLLLWTMIDTGVTESVKLLCINMLNKKKGLKFELLVGNMFRHYLCIAFAISLIITLLISFTIKRELVSLTELANIFLIALLILPSKFVRDYLIGGGRSHIFYVVRVISLAISLPIVLWVLYEGLVTSLTHTLYAINLFTILSSVLLMGIFFADRVPIFFKSKVISRLSISQLKETGSVFLYIGLATFFIQDMDFIFLSLFQSAHQIAEFSLMHRFFQYSQVALSIMIVPLWPYIAAELNANKKAKKIKFYIYFLAIICAFLTFAMFLLSPSFLLFWGNGEFLYSWLDTLPFAIYFFFRCLCAIGVLLLKLNQALIILLRQCFLEAILHFLAVLAIFSLSDHVSNISILVYLWCIITLTTRILPTILFIYKVKE